MLKTIAAKLWGKFDDWQELKKFLVLGSTFGLIIGVYWALRPIKDSIFNAIVGKHGFDLLWFHCSNNIALAKILSVFVIVPLVFVYNKLIDTYPRHKVFYFLLGVYALITFAFAFAFMHPVLGLANTQASPDRIIGWLWYLFVESFGSLIVALFWVITTDITLPESAKRGFPIIALFGQLGNIFGPFVLSVKRLGLTNSAPIVVICGILMVLTVAIMWYFMTYTPKSLLVGYHEADAKMDEPGFLEGLKILFSNGYMLGIFFIVSVYEIIVTVMDNHFKNTTFDVHAAGGEGAVSGFLSDYAVWVGIIATASILLGINNIQRILGIRASLILLPLLIGAAMVSLASFPDSLQLASYIMILSKAINYALNQPTLKQLYIPTTKETRYKTQGWIEMFGSRSAKGSASVVNLWRHVPGFLYFVAFSTLGLVGIWIAIALFVSNKFNKAIEKNEVVC